MTSRLALPNHRPRRDPRALLLAVALALAVFPWLAGPAYPQNAILFSDSPGSTGYDPSWGYANPPSWLALSGGSHFPVDNVHSFLGANALLLAWTSVTGGDWMLTAATASWVPVDLTPSDTLVFAVWSAAGVPAADLPDVLLEDADNTRTPRHPLSAHLPGVVAGRWTRVAIPLSVFRNDPGSADLTRVNKVFFAQRSGPASGVSRALTVDEIRFVGAGPDAPVPPPVTLRAFERHLEVRWEPASIPDAQTVRIERDAAGTWVRAGDVSPADGGFVGWLGGVGLGGSYRAINVSWHLLMSTPGTPVSGTTVALTTDQWLDMEEEAAFRYFWLHAHPVSGLARERYGAGRVCATGGTGMGIMATVAASARGYVPRAAAAGRVRGILNFYATHARSYHGAFAHWIDGATGASIPFDTPTDTAGDIVETSYLVQGILAARQYFDGPDTTETSLRALATQLWRGVDWNAYRRTPSANVIDWLWSPTTGFGSSFPVTGWNETMIVYLLAVASPTHPVPATCYTQGYSRGGAMQNGNTYFTHRLWLGEPYGGPLFFAHYSFLGFDPRGRRDQFANYFAQNRNHTYINRAYCALNPAGRTGYSSSIWGLTASDEPTGYGVHGPYSNDNGTLTPTASLSSMPYTPGESIQALQAMYRTYGQQLWGVFGFYDAYNPGANWYSKSYIAIDQGPIAVMIENFRSHLLWDRFMSSPEIAPALGALGFVPDSSVTDVPGPAPAAQAPRLAIHPNPSRAAVALEYALPARMAASLQVFDLQGRRMAGLASGTQDGGAHTLVWDGRDLQGRPAAAGMYIIRLDAGGVTKTVKFLRMR